MQIRRLKSLLTSQGGEAEIIAMAWSPNNMKFGVCTADRVIILFDESGEQRDKFSTKPCDSKYGKQSYVVKAIAFSPDSAMLAVAQTDNIVFVYKIGADWGEKKSIVAKLLQSTAITCMLWLPDGQIIFGLTDGKIRSGSVKKNKSSTVYTAEHYTVSLATNASGKAILSGHADGSIVRYIFNEEGTGETQGLVCRHTCPPYALSWTPFGIVVGGCDKRVIVYTKDGKTLQQFDYTKDPNEKEFTVSACSPSGQSAIMGSYNRLRVYNWSPRKSLFEELEPKEIANFYTITAISWKKDGSQIGVGNLTGCVDLFDCSLKKQLYKGKFEMTYVGLSQVIIHNKTTNQRVDLKSHYGYEVYEVKILGKDRYVVGHTSDTLMIGDLNNGNLSEIPWRSAAGAEEKFYFENETVCMIFTGGELTLVEYGVNDALASVRTEFMNPYYISVRLNERRQKHIKENKKMAYLIDLKTVSIIDLLIGNQIGQVQHDTKIDWLELNETAKYLLFRDKKMKLHLYNIDTKERNCILNFCTYVNWVPDSDVVVAQNRNNLCIWYNIESYEKVTMVPIKGDIQEVKKENNKTTVIISEGVSNVNYDLDSGLIEFQTALDDGNYIRAVDYLESVPITEETESMWKKLADIALENHELSIAERCYAALGDVAKAKFLKDTNKLSDQSSNKRGGREDYKVRARIAQLEKDLRTAESIYLEDNNIDEAIEMYQNLYKWDDAIELAEAKNHPDLIKLKKTYSQWLSETDQLEKAGALREKEGDLQGAISLYIKANIPARAARVLINNYELMHNQALINQIAEALVVSDLYETAGDLFERIRDDRRALECYKTGKVYRKAVDLARVCAPSDVVKLENEWGDHLASQKLYDAAVNHYIEAGENLKAVDAAINSRQWKKAVEILQTQDSDTALKYYKKIADYYAGIQEYEIAERFYMKANHPKECIEMYNKAGKWEHAFKIATSYLSSQEVILLYSDQAKLLEQQGRYKEAEKLYVTIKDPDQAIQMYKNTKNYDSMIRLMKQYHPDLLPDTYAHLAKEFEAASNFRQAEIHYINANDWKTAVNMYRRADMWEDAYRVAKTNGGPVAGKQVAYLWAKTLGGDSAVKLLTKFGLLEQAIDYATENCAFDFAFELAKSSAKDKIPEINLKYAMYLEDEGRFQEAEQEFLKAKKPREAVLMYVHNKDWDNAQRIAEQYDQSLIPDVLIGQAKLAFDEKNYAKAESFLLRAQRPELAVKLYKDNNMWQDALRVCKEYLPNKLEALRDEYDRTVSDKSTHGVEGMLEQAAKWESTNEHEKAADCYSRIVPSNVIDKETAIKCWLKAFEISNKFLKEYKTRSLVQVIGPKLVELKKYSQAAELYIKVDLVRECIDALIMAEDWGKAKKVAEQLDKSLLPYIEQQYKQSLHTRGDVKELENVDAVAALDIYAKKGQWEECFKAAEKHGELVVHKYLALYATMLMKNGKLEQVLDLYKKYGTPAIPQNYNLYRGIIESTFTLDSLEPEGYQPWSKIRDIIYNLTQNLSKLPDKDSPERRYFEKALLIAHYNAMRAACCTNEQLDNIAAKISISLLRHTDILPADRAFYEAGIMCQKAKWENMAFVFFNRYIDLADAIEEGNTDSLNNADFESTDIPLEINLPEKKFLPAQKHEDIKGWVISTSMNRKIDTTLNTDERGCYEASLIDPRTNQKYLPCVVTGYPVLDNKIEFKNNLAANKDDWNKFLMTSRMARTEELQDCMKFLGTWCNTNPNPNYSFN